PSPPHRAGPAVRAPRRALARVPRRALARVPRGAGARLLGKDRRDRPRSAGVLRELLLAGTWVSGTTRRRGFGGPSTAPPSRLAGGVRACPSAEPAVPSRWTCSVGAAEDQGAGSCRA